jgi:hypothetical protein
MRRARSMRATLGIFLAGCAGSAGCTHNYYYGPLPVACAPGSSSTVVPGSLQYGSVCEVPTRIFGGGTVVAASPGIRSSVTTTAPPSSSTSSQVVVSEPANRSRLSPWRRSDPESSLATTRVDGALDEESTIK